MKALARDLGSYVLVTVCELAVDGTTYSTAVLIDRAGDICGTHRKVFPTQTELANGVKPSHDGVGVYHVDFGRVSVLLDGQHPELWQAAGAAGADVVFWPTVSNSSYTAAMYAALYNYYVVSASGHSFNQLGSLVANDGEIFGDDHCNEASGAERQTIAMKRIDLDQSVLDASDALVLLEQYQGLYIVEQVYSQKWALVASTHTNFTVHEMLRVPHTKVLFR